MAAKAEPQLKAISATVQKTYCAMSSTFGFTACLEVASQNAAFMRNSPLYTLIGKHAVIVAIKPGNIN